MSSPSKDSKRYQLIGFPERRIAFEYYSSQRVLDPETALPAEKAEYQSSTALNRLHHSVLHAWLVNEIDLAIEWSKKGIAFAEIFFWGKWRDLTPTGNMRDLPPDPEYHRKYAAWDYQLLDALLLGVISHDWKFVDKLVTYPRDDIHINIEQTRSNRAWLLLLCGAISRRPWVGIENHFDMTQSQPQKREKLLARMLRSLVVGSDDELEKSTKEYFLYYKKSEKKSEYINRMLPVDASMVFHIAHHWQRPLPVPCEFRNHIIELSLPSSLEDK